jgi:hypothetical protein
MIKFAPPAGNIDKARFEGRNFAFIYRGAFFLAKSLVLQPVAYASVSGLLWHFGNSRSRERDCLPRRSVPPPFRMRTKGVQSRG